VLYSINGAYMDNFIIHMQAICGRFFMVVNGHFFEFEMTLTVEADEENIVKD